MRAEAFVRRVGFGLGPSDATPRDHMAWAAGQLAQVPPIAWDYPYPRLQDALVFLGQWKSDELALRERRGKAPDWRAIRQAFRAGIGFDEHWKGELAARAHSAVAGPTPVLDRFWHFWTNHFAVDGRVVHGEVMGPYTRDTIRARLAGSFADLALAAATSYAMVVYLDNHLSVGPNARIRRRKPELGLNENLARELLELHTLSPSAGYTQEDVVETALVLAGWTVDRPWAWHRGLNSTYAPIVFNPDHAEPGPRRVLGKTYGNSVTSGKDSIAALVRDLARHPACARFIASKLARHFISDAPAGKAVRHIETAFRASGGDLPKVHQATLEAVDRWGADARKFLMPETWLLQAMRLTGTRLYPLADKGAENPYTAEQYRVILAKLGHEPFSPDQPNGYSDAMADWVSPELLDRRLITAGYLGVELARKGGAAERLARETIRRNWPGEERLAAHVAGAARDPELAGSTLQLLLCSEAMMRA